MSALPPEADMLNVGINVHYFANNGPLLRGGIAPRVLDFNGA